jgi:hypothetical protein
VSAAVGLSGGDAASRLASAVLAGAFLLPAVTLLLGRIVMGFRVEPTPRGVMLLGGIWLTTALIAALLHSRRLLPWDLAFASVCIGLAIPVCASNVWLLLAAAASAGMLFVSAVVSGAHARAKGLPVLLLMSAVVCVAALATASMVAVVSAGEDPNLESVYFHEASPDGAWIVEGMVRDPGAMGSVSHSVAVSRRFLGLCFAHKTLFEGRVRIVARWLGDSRVDLGGDSVSVYWGSRTIVQ